MEKGLVLKQLFDDKIISLLEFLFSNKDSAFYLRELSQKTGISVATTYRILNRLASLGIVKVSGYKRFKFYRAASNEITEFLEAMLKTSPIDEFVKKAKQITGISSIVLYGNPKPKKANLFIIGEDVDRAAVDRLIKDIEKLYGFTIQYLVFNKEQYQQMSEMGIYSQQKRTL